MCRSCHMGVLEGVEKPAEASVGVTSSPVIDGWKRRSVSDDGTPSRELCWCIAVICRFSPPGDLHIFWHLSQGKPPETGDMMREGDKRSAGVTGTLQAWIRRLMPTCSTIIINYVFLNSFLNSFLIPAFFYVQLTLAHSRQDLEAMVGCQGPFVRPFRTCGLVWPAPTWGDIKRYALLLTSTPIHFTIAHFIFTSLILYPI